MSARGTFPRILLNRTASNSIFANRAGTAALEFALVAVPFMLLVIGTIEVAYDLFVQAALGYATGVAARSVQVGAVTGTSGESSATFAAAAVCPALSGLLSCSLVTVAVAPVGTGSDYYTTPTTLSFTAAAAGSICTGTAGQLMRLQVWYAGPSFVGTMLPAFSTLYNGARVHLTTASAGFVNEDFTGGQTTGTGC
jgi:Flp pilus assembly protein TadG